MSRFRKNMLHQAKSYLRHLWKAGKGTQQFSPFVSELYREVIKPYKHYYDFIPLEVLRENLLQDEQEIEVTDFGAGSRVMKSNLRKVGEIAKHSLGDQKECELLFKLVNHFKPKVMLELGTSLGVNSLYQASPETFEQFYTFEGCSHIASIAQKNFEQFKLYPEIVIGNLDKTLTNTVRNLAQIDYVFFDANHQYQPTIDYFEICLEKAHENSLFIFDDIHWSEGMTKAWEEIKQHEQVSLTIDLFHLGLVFFRKEEENKHLMLNF